MKRTIVCVFLAAVVASAETLTLVSVGPANDGAYYTGFYGLTVANPPSDPQPIEGLCLDAAVQINVGDSWQATLLSLPDYESFAGLTAQQGDELAYLYTQAQVNTDPGISDAVWTLAGTPVNPTAPDVLSWIGQAQTNYGSIDPSTFQVWTPENSDGGLDLSVSQPFMVDRPTATPDPTSFSLLGFGLLGLGATWRRHRKQERG